MIRRLRRLLPDNRLPLSVLAPFPVPAPLPVLALLPVLVLLLAVANGYAQYSDQTFKLARASAQYDERGFLKGQAITVDGKLAVSNVNGAVSYSYTLDNFTRHGYAFRVGLNYCNSVGMSSFKSYHVGSADQDDGSGVGGPPSHWDYWDRFTRSAPLWIIDVNGFAVQTFSLVSDYLPPSTSGRISMTEKDLPWLVEGYDFCNRMNTMDETGQNDVIRLLRGDGSLLELRNPYKRNVDGRQDYEHVTGHYFEDAMNATGYAVVEFDTTNLTQAMRNELTTKVNDSFVLGDTNYWRNQMYQYLPRIVRYYPGDGLEYTFYEHLMPYGWDRYDGDYSLTGGTIAGPTIFYLREITNASGVVLNLTYSRHEQPGDASAGRALIKSIGDYVEFGYGDLFVGIQAHGRTTSLQLEKAIPLSLFESPGSEAGSTISYVGYVKYLRDPENRTTQFGYENYLRKYSGYDHPDTNIDFIDVTARRLTSVQEPTANYVIGYHEGAQGERTIVYDPNEAPPVALANWRLNNAAHIVSKYTTQNQPLTTETYCFDGISTADPNEGCNTQVLGNPRTVYRLKDRRTLQEKEITYTFQKIELARHRAESAPSALALPLVYTALLSTGEEADGKTVSTTTSYAVQYDATFNAAALVLPVQTETHVYPGSHRSAYSTMSYELEAGHGYGGPAEVANFHTQKVKKATQTVYVPDPARSTEVLLKDVREYLHLPLIGTPQQIAQVVWDKFASVERYTDLYDAGTITCAWEDFPDSLQVYDTLGVRSFVAPPFFGLTEQSYTLGAGGNYLGGTRTVYEQTSVAPGQNRRGLPLRDSVIAAGRASAEPANEYTYGTTQSGPGGYQWVFSDERLPVRLKNANGGIVEQAYRYAARSVPTAVRLNDDGTTAQPELFDRLLTLGLEKPLSESTLIRNARTGAIDTLQVRNEYTFYGLLGAQRDLNGWYSKFHYDNDGRLLSAQLPKDFLGADATCNELYDGIKEYVTPVYRTEMTADTVYVLCPGGSRVDTVRSTLTLYGTLSAVYDLNDAPCTAGQGPILGGGRTGEQATSARTGKRGAERTLAAFIPTPTPVPFLQYKKDVAVCHFDVEGVDNLFDAVQTLRSGSFRFFISEMEGRCFTMSVVVRRLSDGEVMARRQYVLNCSSGGLGTASFGGGKNDIVMAGSSGGDYMFDIRFKNDEILDFAQSGPDGFDVEISVATPGSMVTLVDDAEDKRPRWRLEGVFDLPVEQKQYTLAYEYSPGVDAYTVQRVKTDDPFTSVNYPAGSCRSMRYSETRYDFGADRLVEKMKLDIGDPTMPLRADSTSAVYTGFGLGRKATDQEGYSVWTEYDTWGRPVKTTNADSTARFIAYGYGDPATMLGLYHDQDFFGFCSQELLTVEDSVERISFTDAFGRKRMEATVLLLDPLSLAFITRYEYDTLGRLTTVVNPKGDTTRYWYDGYGRVKYKYQPDMGYISYAYDRMGNVRYTQTQEQADSNRLTFMQYDDMGRVTLVGETHLDGVTGGGHGAIGGKKETPMSFPPHPVVNLNRLTDQIDACALQDGGVSTAVTANATVWMPALNPPPSFWTPAQLEATECVPQPVDPEMPTGTLLRHPVQDYPDPGLPAANPTNFENIAMYPGNARTAIHYDALPASQGAVWLHFPAKAQWDALAPTGEVRNLKGKEAAVAYRGHAGEPYHFTVLSYDERGRVEALLRYTENLGFDAVYYTYNAMNAVTSIRTVDPLRQHTTWYGYDWNGRVDSVWTELSGVGSGLGVASPVYPAPSGLRPEEADLVYAYTKRGQVATLSYPQVFATVNYAYNSRTWLDSMTAVQNGQALFRQKLSFDEIGMITRQYWRHGTAVGDSIHEYTYDNLRRLQHWSRDTLSVITNGEYYYYDYVGNRVLMDDLDAVQSQLYHYTSPTGPNRLMQWEVKTTGGVLLENTDYTYNASGSMQSRTWTGGGNQRIETVTYDRIKGLVLGYHKWEGVQGGFGVIQDWRYRYSAAGEREQKRLYAYSPGLYSARRWVYYALQGSRQLAVYEGYETQSSSCSTGVNMVYLYPTEYNIYAVGDEHSMTIRPTTSGGSVKQYTLQDHLGSTRVVLEGGVVKGTYDYNPWGEVLAQTNQTPRLSWIDKEMDAESGLGDFGVRKYDDGIGRFTSIDPLWEKYRGQTPYNYANNSPLVLMDPTGYGWDEFWKGAKDVAQGAFDAVASDITGQDIRTGDQNSDLYQAAKLGGHVADAALGANLIGVGVGMEVGGTAAAPVTGGASLTVTGGGVLVVAGGVHLAGNALGNIAQMTAQMNKPGGGGEEKKEKPKETVSFTQGRGQDAKKVTVEVPDGYTKTNYYSEKQPVYTNGKNYISPDTYGHNGGVWKMAKKVEELKTRGKRLGTYNEKLERIGD